MNTNFFIFALLLSHQVFAQNETTDTGNVSGEKEKGKSKDSKASNKSIESNGKPEFLIPADDKLLLNSRFQENFHSGGHQIPFLGFSNPGPRTSAPNFIFSDGSARFNVQLQSLHQQRPSHLNTALGAISAHILNNQTPNQEYIPYPPNGNPYNYPAYRGINYATEPPVLRAYETANNVHLNRQPDFISQHPFVNQLHYFFNNPHAFTNPDFYSGLTRNDDLGFGGRFYTQQNTFGQTIK